MHGSMNTGVTLTEFVTLKDNSVVKVAGEGQHIAFAFFSIKKV
jgi:hypothetical protein